MMPLQYVTSCILHTYPSKNAETKQFPIATAKTSDKTATLRLLQNPCNFIWYPNLLPASRKAMTDDVDTGAYMLQFKSITYLIYEERPHAFV